MRLGDILRARVRQEQAAVMRDRRSQEPVGDYVTDEEVQWIPIHAIDPGPFQARVDFPDGAAEELAESIRVHGVLQPIIVRPRGSRFELVVGERRWRACKKLGWKRVPAVVRELDDREAAEVVLIENLQRRDLNPIEVAQGYERILTEFNMTQQALAERLGVSQAAVANKLRLLRLPGEIQEWVREGKLSERHARALLRVEDEGERVRLARWAVDHGATVREVEARVAQHLARASAPAEGITLPAALGRRETGERGPGEAKGAEAVQEPPVSGPQPIPEKGKAASTPSRRKAGEDVEALLQSLNQLLARLSAAGVAVDVTRDAGADGIEITVRISGVER